MLTDIASHDEICARLEAPAVFLEKPLAVDGPRADKLARSLSEKGKRVEVGFFLRHSRALSEMIEAVQKPAMGPVRFARLAFAHPGLRDGWLQSWPAHMAPERMGGGTFADLAIHLVDAARHLLGSIRGTSCDLDIDRDGLTGAGTAIEVQGQATLVSEDGALVHAWASSVAPRVMLTIQVVYENGEIGLDGGQVTRRLGGAEREVPHEGPMPTPADGFRAALEALREDRSPITNLADAVAASTVMDELTTVSKD